MARRKTNAEFVAEVRALVGDEYTFLEEYRGGKKRITVSHNKCGHKYKVMPSNFTNRGTRCPKCANRGRETKTDVTFKREVFDLVGNEYVFLEEYRGAQLKIEVKHSTCGFSYKVEPASFMYGKRCPKCAGNIKKNTNSFKREIHALVGDEFSVLGEYKNNKTKIKMRHNVCGREYEAIPKDGVRCARCSGKEKKSTGLFNEEVSSLVGNEYVFIGEYKNNKTKMPVIHMKCGNYYNVTPSDFKNGYRCPVCFLGGRKQAHEFAQEVSELVGEEYTVLGEYKNAYTKIKMKHVECGNVYEVRPSSFLTGNRCPRCAYSRGERKIEEYLKKRNINFVSEFPLKYEEGKTPLRIDFMVSGVAIEYDGKQHFEPVKAWGGIRNLRGVQRRDRIKNEYCAANGIPMIRIPYWDFDRIDEILTNKLLPIIRNKDDKLA